jgi:hypothetical protein
VWRGVTTARTGLRWYMVVNLAFVVIVSPRRRSATPGHPPKSAEKLAQESGTWFDMYPGRAANDFKELRVPVRLYWGAGYHMGITGSKLGDRSPTLSREPNEGPHR